MKQKGSGIKGMELWNKMANGIVAIEFRNIMANGIMESGMKIKCLVKSWLVDYEINWLVESSLGDF